MRPVTKLRLAVCSFVTFLAISALFAGVLVCPECGYENPEDGVACVHCKGKLTPRKAKDPDQSSGGDSGVRAPSARIQYVSTDVVEDEIRVAQKQFEAGDLEVANLFARNAAALEFLANPAEKGDRAERIAEVRRKTETGGMKLSRKCPACGGTGKTYMESSGLDGKQTNIEIAGRSCKTCGGSGNVMKSATMDERKFRLGRAMKQYNADQHGRKYVAVGGAWIPVELEGKLSQKQMIRLKGAIAAPCADCMGLGRIDCTKCKGQGEIKCTVKGCVGGKVEVEEAGKIVKDKMKRMIKCRICNGTGFVPCVDCRGIGNTVCKKCNGSGERPSCVKCGGRGLIACKRCQGNGSVKDIVCADCKGEGYQECTACNGDGKKK